MNKPIISAIAAIDKNRGIGKNGSIPWKIPEDMTHFKQVTTGHVVIMGRKTYESISKPLSKRTNIIITKQTNFKAEECIIVHTINDAIRLAKELEQNELFIIGGSEIYSAALPFIQLLYLTIIEQRFDCDTFFPDYSDFHIVNESETMHSNSIKYFYQTLSR